MICKRCSAQNCKVFNGEFAIRFPGLDGLEKPIVWVFPKVAICMDCGFAEFEVPERELRVLTTGAPVEGAVFSWQRDRRQTERN